MVARGLTTPPPRVGQYGDAQLSTINVPLRVTPSARRKTTPPQLRPARTVFRPRTSKPAAAGTSAMPSPSFGPPHPSIGPAAQRELRDQSRALSRLILHRPASASLPLSRSCSTLSSASAHIRPPSAPVHRSTAESSPDLPQRPSSAHALLARPSLSIENGKAHYYLQTGIHPDTLLKKTAPQVRRLGDRTREQQRRLEEAERAAKSALIVEQVWARVLRESPSIHGRAPPPAAAPQADAGADSNEDCVLAAAASADADEALRLQETLFDVRSKAFVLQQAHWAHQDSPLPAAVVTVHAGQRHKRSQT